MRNKSKYLIVIKDNIKIVVALFVCIFFLIISLILTKTGPTLLLLVPPVLLMILLAFLAPLRGKTPLVDFLRVEDPLRDDLEVIALRVVLPEVTRHIPLGASGDVLLDGDQERVAITIEKNSFHFLNVAAGLPLEHQASLGAAEDVHLAGLQRLGQRLARHVAERQRAVVLDVGDDAGDHPLVVELQRLHQVIHLASSFERGELGQS